jgi:bifunctional DNA-binding transcriptional regulator/antitoxin component of YhaV-PrlF toxin-antitoxin module
MKFRRKVQDINGSKVFTIPKDITLFLGIEKGTIIEIEVITPEGANPLESTVKFYVSPEQTQEEQEN